MGFTTTNLTLTGATISPMTNTLQDNMLYTNFRLEVVGSLAMKKFENGTSDEFIDQSGIDTTNSINQNYVSVGNYYDNQGPGAALYWATNNHDDTKYCNLGSATDLNVNGFTKLSVFGWFDVPANWSGRPYMVMVSKDESWKFWINPTFGEIVVTLGSGAAGWGGYYRSSIPSANTWHHFGFVYDGSTNRCDVYLDNVKQVKGGGAFVEVGIFPTSLTDTNALSTRIGGNYSGDPNMVNPNKADEFAMWNRALSDGDVTTLYGAGGGVRGNIANSPWNSGLMGGWHFDENAGTSAADFSGNAITGTLQTGVTWTTGKVSGAGLDMTLLSNATTAISAPTSSRIVIVEEDIDTITLNTDLKAYVSNDNGANYVQATLSDVGDVENNKKILAGTSNLVTVGTNVKWKVQTFNNKALRIHAAGQLWQ